MNIPNITDDNLSQLPLHDSNGKIIYIIEEKPLGDDSTITVTASKIDISNPKLTDILANYKKSIELLFEYLTEKHNASQLLLHTTIHNSDMIIYNITISIDNTTLTFNTSDRDDLLDTFFLNKIPIIYQNNLNNCIRFAKTYTMKNTVDSLLLRSTINNSHILRIPNKNIDLINEKITSQLDYLNRIAMSYFNNNRLSKLSNKFGKITSKSRDNFINLLCKDVSENISQDLKFTTVFNELTKNHQDSITSKYKIFATNLIDTHLKK